MIFALASTLAWIVLQTVMLYYQFWALRQTRRAQRVLVVKGDGVWMIGREKERAQWFRLSVIVLNLLLGFGTLAQHVPGYAVFFVFVLLYGEGVLLRNTRADVRLIVELARQAA